MYSCITTHKIYGSAKNISWEVHQFHNLKIKTGSTHAGTGNGNQMGDGFWRIFMSEARSDCIHRQKGSLFGIKSHPLFNGRKWIQSFSLRVKLPLSNFA